MTTTTTHDTKRSEDVRARLSLLSEIPEVWGRGRRRVVGAQRTPQDGRVSRSQRRIPPLPDPPRRLADRRRPGDRVHAQGDPRSQGPHGVDRAGNEAYETALKAFIAGILADRQFLADLLKFVEPLDRPRPDQLPVAGPPEAHGARGAGRLPGERTLGHELGRPRQPPAGRLRETPEAPGRPQRPGDAGRDHPPVRRGIAQALGHQTKALHLRRSRPELFGPEGSTYRRRSRRGGRRPTTSSPIQGGTAASSWRPGCR